LGSELLTNGDFEGTFTEGLANGWLKVIGSEVVAVETTAPRSGSAAQKLNTAASGAGIYQYKNAFLVAGQWYMASVWGKHNTGSVRISVQANGALAKNVNSTTDWQQSMATFRFASGSTGIYVYASAATAMEFFVDDATLTQLPLTQLLATIAGASSNQTAAAKIVTLTSGIQSGVVALLDSASSPQSFLNAYHDGTGVTLDKCVAGICTNVVPRVTVAFVANAQIEIRRPSGNTFQLWYNGVQRGTDQTVADTSIINNTRYGLFSTHSGGTFSEFSLGGVVIPFNLPGA
jgi:hypothetical protein